MVTTTLRRLLTSDEFQQMAEKGIFDEDERIELIDGEIYHMAAVGLRHIKAVRVLNRILNRQVGQFAVVDVQNPIRLNDGTMPQPDAIVLRDRDYDALTTPTDVFLVIEVGDSSRTYDRETKFPRYAAASIPEAWLVDLIVNVIERHSDPQGGAYQQIITARAGETLTSTVLPEITIPVRAVLGPPGTPQEVR